MKRIVLVLLLSGALLQASHLSNLMARYRHAPKSQRYKIMNQIKQEIARLNKSRQRSAIRKLRYVVGSTESKSQNRSKQHRSKSHSSHSHTDSSRTIIHHQRASDTINNFHNSAHDMINDFVGGGSSGSHSGGSHTGGSHSGSSSSGGSSSGGSNPGGGFSPGGGMSPGGFF